VAAMVAGFAALGCSTDGWWVYSVGGSNGGWLWRCGWQSAHMADSGVGVPEPEERAEPGGCVFVDTLFAVLCGDACD
jgi:hypothetical protein